MKKLKVGIVGLGRIAVLGHIPEIGKFPDRFEIVAVADIIPERLEESHTKLSGVKNTPRSPRCSGTTRWR